MCVRLFGAVWMRRRALCVSSCPTIYIYILMLRTWCVGSQCCYHIKCCVGCRLFAWFGTASWVPRRDMSWSIRVVGGCAMRAPYYMCMRQLCQCDFETSTARLCCFLAAAYRMPSKYLMIFGWMHLNSTLYDKGNARSVYARCGSVTFWTIKFQRVAIRDVPC